MNKVLIVGRLTHEPEKVTTSSGITYVRFSVAVTRSFSKDQTDFVPIVAWRQSADFVANYMHKGYLISIEGVFTSSRYQNANGQMVTRYEVTADRVANLEPRRDRENANNHITKAVKTEKVEGLQNIEFESDKQKNENKVENKKKENEDVPWDIEF